MAKPELSFYDVKSKAKFNSTEYEIREKNGRFFAVSAVPNAEHEAWRILSKVQAEEIKNMG